ncbi:MAG: methyltransferase domain-containing protein [Clostridia bacterium]|nr:methyltransferase domain-containing protein [Clostridia bacterium]
MLKLKCPVCGGELNVTEKMAECALGHRFDRAASGYLNLLLSQNKYTKDPGDSRDMVLSRRRFLDAGYYAPLRTALVSKVKEISPETLLDAGAGEGYYTSEFSFMAETIGVDLSKDAVLRASKRDKQGLYCVSSIFDLPVFDNSIDVITSIFAPYSSNEFYRVAKRVVAVIPGEKHLFGLKEMLYEKPYLNDEKGYDLPGFDLVSRDCVDFAINLNSNDEILDLFSMTPYFWRTPRDAVSKLGTLQKLVTPISFRILEYKKR